MEQQRNLIEVRDLACEFSSGKSVFKKKKTVKAVNHVNLDIRAGETLGLVGESGCGKSTLGRCILQLIRPTGGTVTFEGEHLERLGKEEMRQRRRDLQMIFQDPYSCLNPRMSALEQVKAPLDVFGIGTERERTERATEMLETVGISKYQLQRFPHEFSGGQRQRIGIARALITHPKFVVCDEPVSALDVSVRASVLNLMQELQEKMDLTYLFISHDLSVVRHISRRVAVMYLGHIVEIADRTDIYLYPKHPYTEALLAAIPIPDPEYPGEEEILEGELPSPYDPPAGCPFHERCRFCMDLCKENCPQIREIEPGHMVACHLYDTTQRNQGGDI